MTSKPVEFPAEAKILFGILPDLVLDTYRCRESVKEYMNSAEQLFSKKFYGEVEKREIEYVEALRNIALDSCSLALHSFEDMVNRGLLRKDLDVTDTMKRHFTYVLDSLSHENSVQRLLELIEKNGMRDATRIIYTALKSSSALFDIAYKLKEEYRNDPPEGDPGFAKIVAVILALLVGGAVVLSKL